MKRVTWTERKPGMIFFSAVPGFLHELIWKAERDLHPDAPTDLAASHVGIIGPYYGFVTEAWLGAEGDSAACVVEDSKYEGPATHGQVEVWDAGIATLAVQTTFDDFLKTYVGDKYGWEDLIGLGVKALLHDLGLNINNPIYSQHMIVCSMAVCVFLQTAVTHSTPSLEWTRAIVVGNCDPVLLRMLVLNHVQA